MSASPGEQDEVPWTVEVGRRRAVRAAQALGSSLAGSTGLVSCNLKGQKPSVIFLWGFSLLMTVLTDPVLFIH